jgi:hypothetical protein
MKKLISIVAIFSLMLTLAACQKQENLAGLSLEKKEVEKTVSDWAIYTNGSFRYELRQPKDWMFYEVGEFGKEVFFHPVDKETSDTYLGAVRIVGYVNYKTNYTLEEFYKNQPQDLFAGNFEREEIKFAENRAVWFKKVNSIYENKEVDVITIDGGDRIVEYYIMDEWSTAQVMFNTMYFYGQTGIKVGE